MKLFLALALGAWFSATCRAADDPSDFFENQHPAAAGALMPGMPLLARFAHGRAARGHSRGAAQRGTRGPAIVPGKPAQSLLLRAVRQTDAALKMPPSGKLKDAEIAALAEWIEMGAPWGAPKTTESGAAPAQKYWAFVPPAESDQQIEASALATNSRCRLSRRVR